MSWGQPFRLRHMATGKFLGVRSDASAGCCGGEESGRGTEGKSRRRKKPHQLILLGPDQASKEATTFHFSTANVSPAPPYYIDVCFVCVCVHVFICSLVPGHSQPSMLHVEKRATLKAGSGLGMAIYMWVGVAIYMCTCVCMCTCVLYVHVCVCMCTCVLISHVMLNVNC